MTRNATHDPKYKRKHSQPPLLKIKKRKLTSPTPFQKKKILDLWGACCISSLNERDLVLKFVGCHLNFWVNSHTMVAIYLESFENIF